MTSSFPVYVLAYSIITLLNWFVCIVLPGIVDMPTVSEIRSRDVVVTWTRPSSDSGSLSTHYIIEQQLVSLYGASLLQDDTSWMRINTSILLMSRVASLSPYTGYRFRVTAENMAGSGPPSLSSVVSITLEAGRYVGTCMLPSPPLCSAYCCPLHAEC